MREATELMTVYVYYMLYGYVTVYLVVDKNEAIHKASPVYSQMGYIGARLALCQLYRM